MKHIGVLVLFVCGLFLGSLAQADFFKCTFTEPFFGLYVSTSNMSVTVDNFVEAELSQQMKILKITDADGVLTMNLESGQDLQVFWNVPGSDGMSDRNFPYEAKMGDFYGGCGREFSYESTYRSTLLERWPSWDHKNGLVFVNEWLGEGIALSSYTLLKPVTLSAGTTLSSLRYNKKAEAPCTLPKGKVISPAYPQPNERFGMLTAASTTVLEKSIFDFDGKVGDSLTVLTGVGEGYCMVEKDGKVSELDCISEGIEVPYGQKYQLDAQGSYYAFTKCEEGHYTWISTPVLDKQPDIAYGDGF